MSKVKYKDKTYIGTPSINGTELVGDIFPSEFGLVDLIYPVGSFFESSNANFNPNTYFGGTWTEVSGRALVSANNTDSTFRVDYTGGTNDIPVFSHTHGTDTQGAHSHIVGVTRPDVYKKDSSWGIDAGMPWYSTAATVDWVYTAYPVTHSHSTSTSTGSSGTWANWPPYIIVKCWYRTA